jgi:hypothetical protein
MSRNLIAMLDADRQPARNRHSKTNSNTFPQFPANYLVLGTIVFLTTIHHPRYLEPQTWTIRFRAHGVRGRRGARFRLC